jgi:hypothetical protein
VADRRAFLAGALVAAAVPVSADPIGYFLHIWIDRFDPVSATFIPLHISEGPLEAPAVNARMAELKHGLYIGVNYFPAGRIKLAEVRLAPVRNAVNAFAPNSPRLPEE